MKFKGLLICAQMKPREGGGSRQADQAELLAPCNAMQRRCDAVRCAALLHVVPTPRPECEAGSEMLASRA